MKVYIAQREYDYEGFQIIGIYQTKEEAEAAINKDKEDGYGDSHSVEDYIIGKDYS